MAKQTINIGTSANDGTGSTLREAFDITNDNFTELYDGTGGLLHKIEGTNFTGSLLIGHSTTGTLNNAQGNVGIGIGALDALTSADNNIAIGRNAGTALTSGVGNVAIGHEALFTEDTNGANVAIGFRALKNQNAGADAYNIAIGHSAGQHITTGIRNTVVGGLAGDALTQGIRNTGIGYLALSGEDTGNRNTAVGHAALNSLNFSGDGHNVAIGNDAGVSINTGVQNTILGSDAGDALTTGSNNIIIGYDAAASAVDVSNEVTIGNSSIANVRIPSDSTLKIGASGDLQLEHVSSNSFIKNTAVGDLYIENQVDDADVIFRCDNGSGGLDTYFKLDGANSIVSIAKPFFFQDNVKVYIGNSFDLEIYHDATNSVINNKTGDFIIQNSADNKDVIFKSDDGSGGLTTYFKLDGATSKTIFETSSRHKDNVKANFGDGEDLEIYHDGTNSYMQQTGTGDLIIENTTDDKDIKLKSDDGSGGTEIYINIDGSARATKFERPTFHNDSIKAKFGNDSDLEIYFDGHSRIENNTGDFVIQTNLDDGDIRFRADDGSGGIAEYFRVDGGAEIVVVSKEFRFADSVPLKLGSGPDLEISHNGNNSLIRNSTGDLDIANLTDDGDIVFKCDDGSGGLATYMTIDGGAELNRFVKNVMWNDSVVAYFGGGFDLQIYHDGTSSYIKNATGNLNIQQNADDADISFQSDDGSGSLAEYFRVDGGENRIVYSQNSRHLDNVVSMYGSGADLQIKHDGSNSYISNNTGHIRIINFADDSDIVFQSDDGSGGIMTYLTIDGSAGLVNLPDNIPLAAGTGNDLRIFHESGGTSKIENYTGNLTIQQRADDSDIVFQCDDGSGGLTEYFRVDGGIEMNVVSKTMLFTDNVRADFGGSNDLRIYHNGTNSNIENFTGTLQIIQNLDDGDISFKSDNGSGGTTEYFRVDGSSGYNIFSKNLYLIDNVQVLVGTGQDLRIYHNGTNNFIEAYSGNLTIQNHTDDADIVFKSDDGSGGTTTYLQLDGSEVSTKILTQKVIMSNLPTSDPSNAGQLYNDSGVLKVSAG